MTKLNGIYFRNFNGALESASVKKDIFLISCKFRKKVFEFRGHWEMFKSYPENDHKFIKSVKTFS